MRAGKSFAQIIIVGHARPGFADLVQHIAETTGHTVERVTELIDQIRSLPPDRPEIHITFDEISREASQLTSNTQLIAENFKSTKQIIDEKRQNRYRSRRHNY